MMAIPEDRQQAAPMTWQEMFEACDRLQKVPSFNTNISYEEPS